MSLQIKKPLSAQAVGTDMYKNGGVNQIKPATKQPEWSTKILAYYGETEKKNYLQRPRCPTWHNAWIWNTWWSVEGHRLTSAFRSVVHFMMDKSWSYQAQRIWSPALWFRAVGALRIALTQGRNSDVMLLKFMLYRADMVGSLNPALRILEWWSEAMFSRGQRADKEDAGLVRVITHLHLYKETWVRE